MNNAVDYAERRAEIEPAPFSVSHLIKTIYSYLPVIGLSMLSIAIGYTVCAILLYVLSPAQRTTTQPFRLEFRGAAEGMLPNGVRFSATEIISTPVLLRVYEADQLSRFVKFGPFSRAIFILESNPAYERLVSEYQSRLSDPKLSPPDRDRLQKEFESKRDSIKKNDYSLSYAPTADDGRIPETLVRKVLVDILKTWANLAINEQHALDYRVAVISPNILDSTDGAANDPIVAIQILRSKIYRVIDNITELSTLPGAELVRTNDRLTLAEIRIRLEDIVRFRLEPLVAVARSSGLVRNSTITLHFVESQLLYDQRNLQAARSHANAARDALLMYNNDLRPDTAALDTAPGARQRPSGAGPEPETVMPQLSDSFLERLVSISKQAIDSEYRQRLIEDYRRTINDTVPLEQAVSYQEQLLAQLRSGAPTPGPAAEGEMVQSSLAASTAEVRTLIAKLNDIYQLLSRNLNPSTQLYSITAPPYTRIERKRTLSRLGLYGLVTLLVSLPIVLMLCLIHNRVREEDAAEREITRGPAEEPA